MMKVTIENRSRTSMKRRGAATVELAICLPFLMALAFGMLEYNNIVMLRSRMISAAYEAARFATRPTTSANNAASAASVSSYCDCLLTQLGVNGATVTIKPANLNGITPLTPVTVSISAPFSSNSLTTLILGSSMTTTASATLIVE